MTDLLNTPLFPKSRIADFAPDDQYDVTHDTIIDIAEEARQAFFKVVVDRIKDLYPDAEMYGDETPGKMYARNQIAFDWVMEHARNSEAVQAYEEEWCVLEGLEACDVEALFHDPLPEGLAVVEVGSFMGGVMAITLRGTRRAIYDFTDTHWGWDSLTDVDDGFGPECIVPDIATPTGPEQAS